MRLDGSFCTKSIVFLKNFMHGIQSQLDVLSTFCYMLDPSVAFFGLTVVVLVLSYNFYGTLVPLGRSHSKNLN
jgi:hypothetical protein